MKNAQFAIDRQRWGLRRALYQRLMARLRRWLFLCRVHARPMIAERAADTGGDGIEVRIATRADLDRALGTLPDQLKPAFVDAALARGDLCAAAFDHGRMVSFVWRSFSTAPHGDGLWVAFDKPYRYGYKAFTHPDYRGRHIMQRITVLTDAVCIERGYTHAIGFVETHNFASIIADLRNGNRLVGFAGYLRLFGHVLPFRTPGARRHTFRFYRNSDGG